MSSRVIDTILKKFCKKKTSTVVYETLRHTTSGIFDPLEDSDELSNENLEFQPSKSPCCHGRTFNFDFRQNGIQQYWPSTYYPPRQVTLDPDSGQVSVEEEELVKKIPEGKTMN